MSNIFQIIEDKLKDFPELRVDKTLNYIAVLPQYGDSFKVMVEERQYSYVVSFDAWQLGFRKNEEGTASAVNLFMFGLSSSCRLKIFQKEGVDYKWDVEYIEDGKWVQGASRPLVSGLGEKTEFRYLHNNIILTDDLTLSFLEIANDSKRISSLFLLTLACAIVLFYALKVIGYGGVVAYFLLFFPVILVPYVLVQNGINSWFDHRIIKITRKYQGRPTDKGQINKRFIYFLLAWGAFFGTLMYILYLYLGKDIIGWSVLLWPFLFCIFLLPAFFAYDKCKL